MTHKKEHEKKPHEKEKHHGHASCKTMKGKEKMPSKHKKG
jgi:hypothetical protein